MSSNPGNSTIPWFLLALLVLLVVLLIYFYKKLNRENDGQYTIERMIYKEGGVRDRVRGAALVLGAFLGIQLWPHSETSEDGEEMQEIHDEEAKVEDGNCQGSDTDGDEEDEEEEEEEEEEEKRNLRNSECESSDGNTNVQGAEAGEQAKLIDEAEPEEKKEGKKEVEEEEQGKAEASGGPGLLIDLKQFSGSAIWSEEEQGEICDVTPL